MAVPVAAQEIVEGAKIVYTYDVYWQNSNIKWTSRWDAYLRMPGGKVGGAATHTQGAHMVLASGAACVAFEQLSEWGGGMAHPDRSG